MLSNLIDQDKCGGFGSGAAFFKHKLLDSGLFTDEKLGELIENYPRAHYNVNTMSEIGKKRTWRDGEFGGTPGVDVLEAVKNGANLVVITSSLKKILLRSNSCSIHVFLKSNKQIPDFKYSRA